MFKEDGMKSPSFIVYYSTTDELLINLFFAAKFYSNYSISSLSFSNLLNWSLEYLILALIRLEGDDLRREDSLFLTISATEFFFVILGSVETVPPF